MFGAKKFVKQAPVAAFVAANAGTIGAVVGIAGAVKSAQAAREQAKQQDRAEEAQGRMAQASSARERLKAAREARIMRAQVLAKTGNMGLGVTSSGPMGATSSTASQYSDNVGHANVMEGFAGMASRANQKAADAGAKGARWQTIGQVGGQFADWNSIFSSDTSNWMHTASGKKYGTDLFSPQSRMLANQERGMFK